MEMQTHSSYKMEKNRSDFNMNFTISIKSEDRKVKRVVMWNGKIIYQETFAPLNDWMFGGGNPVLDLFEKRFLGLPESRENISQYRCDISNGGRGIRRLLSKILDIQIRFINRFRYTK